MDLYKDHERAENGKYKIKTKKHGLVNKYDKNQQKKKGIRPTCRPKIGRLAGAIAIPANKKALA